MNSILIRLNLRNRRAWTGLLGVAKFTRFRITKARSRLIEVSPTHRHIRPR